jgi:hypothetical protein
MKFPPLLSTIERFLPYTILFPFLYFLYSPSSLHFSMPCAYDRLRSSLIRDFKSGQTKSTFLSLWLRDITLSKKILNNAVTQRHAVALLKKTLSHNPFNRVSTEVLQSFVLHPDVLAKIQAASVDVLRNSGREQTAFQRFARTNPAFMMDRMLSTFEDVAGISEWPDITDIINYADN